MPDTRLPLLTIPNPCTADVGAMTGTGAKRFCERCRHPVHLVDVTDHPRQRQLAADARYGRVCVALVAGLAASGLTGCEEPRTVPDAEPANIEVAAPGIIAGEAVGEAETTPLPTHHIRGSIGGIQLGGSQLAPELETSRLPDQP